LSHYAAILWCYLSHYAALLFFTFCVRHLINAVGQFLLHANCWGVDLLSSLVNRVRCSDNHCCLMDIVCRLVFFSPLQSIYVPPVVTICTVSGHYMYRQWSLYLPPVVNIFTASDHYMYRQWSLYVPPVVTIFTASGHCVQAVGS
jgi:hypothetical protein